jgi:hypothetical protein
MLHKKRGIALILCESDPAAEAGGQLKHDVHDVPALEVAFTALGFEVRKHVGHLTASAMARAVQDLGREDHDQHDAAIVCTMSHGSNGKIWGSDHKPVQIDSMIDDLADLKCPSLTGKPKMFFISACRGHGRNTGADQAVAADDLPGTWQANRVAAGADVFIQYGTLGGNVGWGATSHVGSMFIQVLAEKLKVLHGTCHLADIAVEVNGAVSERAIRGADEHELQFQQPEIVNRLRKQLYFLPGPGQ